MFMFRILEDVADERLLNLKANNACKDAFGSSYCKTNVMIQCPVSCSQYNITELATIGISSMTSNPLE